MTLEAKPNGVPPDFLAATAEEALALEKLEHEHTLIRMEVALLEVQIRAAKAEMEKAELQKDDRAKKLSFVLQRKKILEKALGILGPEDKIEKYGSLYIRKRPETPGVEPAGTPQGAPDAPDATRP